MKKHQTKTRYILKKAPKIKYQYFHEFSILYLKNRDMYLKGIFYIFTGMLKIFIYVDGNQFQRE